MTMLVDWLLGAGLAVAAAWHAREGRWLIAGLLAYVSAGLLLFGTGAASRWN